MAVATSTAILIGAAITASAAAYSGIQSSNASRRQKRIANDQMKVAAVEQANQSSEAEKQRKELVDQQRAMMNVGQRFATSTRDQTPKDSGLRGKLTNDVLG